MEALIAPFLTDMTLVQIAEAKEVLRLAADRLEHGFQIIKRTMWVTDDGEFHR